MLYRGSAILNERAQPRGSSEGQDAAISAVVGNPAVPSTLEAAALCKMADRKQITGAILEGPLALDNAISPEAVKIKNIDSPVAGRANVLVAGSRSGQHAREEPDVPRRRGRRRHRGGRAPIILTSRADPLIARLASCAVAALVAGARRASGTKKIG